MRFPLDLYSPLEGPESPLPHLSSLGSKNRASDQWVMTLPERDLAITLSEVAQTVCKNSHRGLRKWKIGRPVTVRSIERRLPLTSPLLLTL
jgi:hypothetical protein